MPAADLDGEGRVGWVSLGCDVGRRDRTLSRLRDLLRQDGVLLQLAASPVIYTRALGPSAQDGYHNQVLKLEAQMALPAEAWLRRCKTAERAAGRRETYRWGPRVADVDLLLLGADGAIRFGSDAVRVPHPELGNRPFLHALLASIDPGLRHPDGWLFAEYSGIWHGLRAETPPS